MLHDGAVKKFLRPLRRQFVECKRPAAAVQSAVWLNGRSWSRSGFDQPPAMQTEGSGEQGERIDAIHLCGLQECGDRCRGPPAVGSGEECILASDGLLWHLASGGQ